MTDKEFMKGWKVIKSLSNKHPEYGYPMGQILCRSQADAEKFINSTEFKDCVIEDYKHEYTQK